MDKDTLIEKINELKNDPNIKTEFEKARTLGDTLKLLNDNGVEATLKDLKEIFNH